MDKPDTDKLVQLPEWYYWSDGRLEYENQLFALRCAESLRDHIVVPESEPVKKQRITLLDRIWSFLITA